MNQRMKVTEVMLAEAVKDRERLVCENQTAVENLLATINSKDQLLKVLQHTHMHVHRQTDHLKIQDSNPLSHIL